MTRDQYFEMCEALGTEPLEEEIPVDYEDLPIDVHQAYNIYNKLQDNWDTMSGVYIGKVYAGIIDIFDMYEIDKEERKVIFSLLQVIDRHRSELISQKKNAKQPPS